MLGRGGERMREIMTPEQVADYLQFNKDTVYRPIRGRKLPAVKIGRAYRVPREDVEAFLVANSTRPQLRSALFKRVLEIAERNAQRHPDLSSDDILEELEAWDEEQKAQRAHAQRA
ncbi:MAG: helix-turn-helix domain-containing protein [Chloroflexi bacterium]|nr:helix-turn-helix domain-containing protein [Chloroflexota bacterium]